jgi:hypothetical protein
MLSEQDCSTRFTGKPTAHKLAVMIISPAIPTAKLDSRVEDGLAALPAFLLIEAYPQLLVAYLFTYGFVVSAP